MEMELAQRISIYNQPRSWPDFGLWLPEGDRLLDKCLCMLAASVYQGKLRRLISFRHPFGPEGEREKASS